MSIQETEGTVYLCDWRKVGSSFEIRVRARPDWNATGSSFAEAELNLIWLLEKANRDLQPCFEYQPEPPKEAVQARFEGPGIVAVSGANDPLDHVGAVEELFAGGICSICKNGIGERTRKPLAVHQFPKAADGAFVRIRMAGPFGNMSIEIFSQEFTNALTPEERCRFNWIPVEAGKKSERKFFEPLGSPLVTRIMPKGLFSEAERLQPDGFHCRKCGRLQLAGIPQRSGGIYTFISEADLPKPVPSCFQVGYPAGLEFCMTKERWNALVGKPGTRRLLSRPVGVVKKNWINPNPQLESLS